MDGQIIFCSLLLPENSDFGLPILGYKLYYGFK